MNTETTTGATTLERQQAATSALNQLTVRHGAEGRVEIPELGSVRVEAHQTAGAVAVEVHVAEHVTAEALRQTHGTMLSYVRGDALPVWRVDIRQEKSLTGDPSGGRNPQREEPEDEPEGRHESQARFVL